MESFSSPGSNPASWVFPAKGYESFSEQFIGTSSPLTKRGRVLRRHFHGELVRRQARFQRPRAPAQAPRRRGRLEGTCVVIGMEDYFEVWNEKRWQAAEAEVKETVTDVAEGHGEES